MQWLARAGWQIVRRRAEVGGVEVDILARNLGGILHIVEVKSSGALSRGIVSREQVRRLRRAALALAACGEPVGLIAMVVCQNGIEIFPL